MQIKTFIKYLYLPTYCRNNTNKSNTNIRTFITNLKLNFYPSRYSNGTSVHYTKTIIHYYFRHT